MPFFTVSETRLVRAVFSIEASTEDEAEFLFLASSDRLRLFSEDVLESKNLSIEPDDSATLADRESAS